tara:strand:+ start:1368 stop:1529 length:162 start_codon:yes stop_codon:yes gene_type:complete
MNIVKIYKEKDTTPTFVIESESVIDTKQYIILWDCKEEIYIDEKLIDTKYHTI